MSRRKSRSHILTTSLAISLTLYICSLPNLALARKVFNPPSGRGLPGRREPAGTRGKCIESQLIPNLPANNFPGSYKTLAALTPAPDRSIGQTLSNYPTFFWYQPAFKQGYANTLEFVLVDEQRKPLYRTFLPVTGKAGVMSFTLPEKQADNKTLVRPLEIGKVYRWTVNVVCDLEDRSAEDFIEGYVERIVPSRELVTRISKASPRMLPEIYAGAGIWHEALATLAELRRKSPNDIQLATTWENLLEAVDFRKLAREPLVDCCRPEKANISSANHP
ncbi:MAG: DUF928 domain-containing protein [Leptolyngbyaceae cyanobacterium bins.59]|nr:DUF928 domain-containing protein [Leptolyngbyaceae cyanobacterium bins.59]